MCRPLLSGEKVIFLGDGIGQAGVEADELDDEFVQPVLEELDTDVEEAAALLGAGRLATFRRVILPSLVPAILTGFALAFARALGEYGSVVFISGNMPMKTEIAPLLIVTKLEQYDYAGATAIATVMLAASFTLLFGINLLQRWARRAEA